MLSYKITFYIRTNRTNQEGKAPIYYRLWLNNDKIEVSTGLHIEDRLWDEKKQIVKKSSEANLINNGIQAVRSALIEAITKLHLSGSEVTIDNVKALMKGETITETYYLINVTSEHNQMFEKQVGIKYSWGSYKNYRTTLAFLKEFVKGQFKKQDIPLKEVNQKFCELYFVWLTTVKTCQQNGAAKHLQRLKKVMNYSVRMGYIQVNPLQSYQITMKQVARVALTWEEIQKIQHLRLQTKTLEDIRNIFIFQVFTGLAYSDVKALSRKHLMKGTDDKLWLRMERTKTHNTFAVPLLQTALEILQAYMAPSQGIDEPIFPVLSNQKMNQNLKIIQEIAGISKSLHTHLPRHTFASTITLLNGVPLETVSKMLGHSKITMTQTYAKVGELKIAGDMKLLESKLNKKNR